jgi:hypothetical protein
MLDALLSNTWLVAVIWAVLYVIDYGSTLWLQDVYRGTLGRYVVYEGGVELNPNFEKEIARRQVLSPKFIAGLVLIFLLIFLSGFVLQIVTEVLAGATVLTWTFIDLRHLRNYTFVRFLRRRPDSLKGRLHYSYWLLQRLIAADAFGFALLYGFLALLTLRIFFLTGAITCLALAQRQYRLADRKLPVETQTEES